MMFFQKKSSTKIGLFTFFIKIIFIFAFFKSKNHHTVKKYLNITLFFLLVLSSACTGFEEVKLLNIKDVTYQEFKGNVLRLSMVATVDNPNMFSVRIKDANMDLRLSDQVIGAVTQVEPIVLDGRTKKDYKINVSIEIKLKDMLSNIMGLSRVLMNEPQKLNLSGTVHVRYFLYSKTYEVERLSFQ